MQAAWCCSDGAPHAHAGAPHSLHAELRSTAPIPHHATRCTATCFIVPWYSYGHVAAGAFARRMAVVQCIRYIQSRLFRCLHAHHTVCTKGVCGIVIVARARARHAYTCKHAVLMVAETGLLRNANTSSKNLAVCRMGQEVTVCSPDEQHTTPESSYLLR